MSTAASARLGSVRGAMQQKMHAPLWSAERPHGWPLRRCRHGRPKAPECTRTTSRACCTAAWRRRRTVAPQT